MAKENMVQKRVNKTSMPGSYIQYCRSLEIQLPGMLFVRGFLLQSDRLKQVKTIETVCWDLVKGNHDRLIEVTVFRGQNYSN